MASFLKTRHRTVPFSIPGCLAAAGFSSVLNGKPQNRPLASSLKTRHRTVPWHLRVRYVVLRCLDLRRICLPVVIPVSGCSLYLLLMGLLLVSCAVCARFELLQGALLPEMFRWMVWLYNMFFAMPELVTWRAAKASS